MFFLNTDLTWLTSFTSWKIRGNQVTKLINYLPLKNKILSSLLLISLRIFLVLRILTQLKSTVFIFVFLFLSFFFLFKLNVFK